MVEEAVKDRAGNDRIAEHLDRSYVAPGKIAGCQTAVVRHGELAHFSSLGSMDIERGRPMARRLADELYGAAKGEGKAMSTREQTIRMAEANKAFAHFAGGR